LSNNIFELFLFRLELEKARQENVAEEEAKRFEQNMVCKICKSL